MLHMYLMCILSYIPGLGLCVTLNRCEAGQDPPLLLGEPDSTPLTPLVLVFDGPWLIALWGEGRKRENMSDEV